MYLSTSFIERNKEEFADVTIENYGDLILFDDENFSYLNGQPNNNILLNNKFNSNSLLGSKNYNLPDFSQPQSSYNDSNYVTNSTQTYVESYSDANFDLFTDLLRSLC